MLKFTYQMVDLENETLESINFSQNLEELHSLLIKKYESNSDFDVNIYNLDETAKMSRSIYQEISNSLYILYYKHQC